MKKKEDIKQIVLELAQAAFDKKGRDIEILDLEGISMLGDYFLIVSANNSNVFGGDELREFYSLEELWNDAGRVPFEGV